VVRSAAHVLYKCCAAALVAYTHSTRRKDLRNAWLHTVHTCGTCVCRSFKNCTLTSKSMCSRGSKGSTRVQAINTVQHAIFHAHTYAHQCKVQSLWHVCCCMTRCCTQCSDCRMLVLQACNGTPRVCIAASSATLGGAVQLRLEMHNE
jgi:hypothetical protein